MCDLQNKLKHSKIDAEKSKQTEIKEPLQQKAGEDILEALIKVSYILKYYFLCDYFIAVRIENNTS